MKSQATKFYQKKWFIWVMVLLFFPIGFYLYFKYYPVSHKTKTTIFSLLFLFSAIPPYNAFKIILAVIPFLFYAVFSYRQMKADEKREMLLLNDEPPLSTNPPHHEPETDKPKK